MAFAGKHAPLPTALMEAKSVYIQNDSGYADLGDRCFEELAAWGRFKIAKSADVADLVFVISVQTAKGGYSGSATTNQYGNSSIALDEDSIRHTVITVIQESTNKAIWTDTRKWGVRHSATKEIVKGLRQRVEEQESSHQRYGPHRSHGCWKD